MRKAKKAALRKRVAEQSFWTFTAWLDILNKIQYRAHPIPYGMTDRWPHPLDKVLNLQTGDLIRAYSKNKKLFSKNYKHLKELDEKYGYKPKVRTFTF